MKQMYFDYQATTPVDERVLQAMLPYFRDDFGNAASQSHEYGWRAEAAVDRARKQIAEGLGASEHEIIFTSGGTESNNLALVGLAEQFSPGDEILTTSVEHRSVLEPIRFLEKRGLRVRVLSVDSFGRLSPEDLESACSDRTRLLSLIYANNEVGTVNPIADIARVCKERKIFLHTDAVQAIGKLPVNVEKDGVDLLSLSSHKIYGPKGVGALYLRRKNPRVMLEPLLRGGGHERGLRSGTLNVPAIVGLGEAFEISARELDTESERLRRMRDRVFSALKEFFPRLRLNGHPGERLSSNLNLCIPGVKSAWLIGELKGIAISSGSACSSATPEPSHVLKALGLSEEDSESSIRISFGRMTTDEEVDFLIEKLKGVLSQCQK